MRCISLGLASPSSAYPPQQQQYQQYPQSSRAGDYGGYDHQAAPPPSTYQDPVQGMVDSFGNMGLNSASHNRPPAQNASGSSSYDYPNNAGASQWPPTEPGSGNYYGNGGNQQYPQQQQQQQQHGYYQPHGMGDQPYAPFKQHPEESYEMAGTIRSPATELPGHDPHELEAPGPKFVRQPEQS